MKEAKWRAATDPKRMLKFLKGRRLSDRKLWLFDVACFRRVWDRVDENVHQAMAVTERYADGQATDDELRQYNTTIDAFDLACSGAAQSRTAVVGTAAKKREALAQCDLVREIFGSPFRPVTLDPSWLTSTVLALANGIYDEKAFDRMPILADALQDAGCTNEDILNHCRSESVHVRGCWVVDLVLGKE